MPSQPVYASYPSKSNSQNFEQLYLEHQSWLFTWLCKKVGCADEAADFAQDTFCRLLTCKTLTELKQPRAFLTTTATRVVIDASRRKQIEQHYLAQYYYYHGEQSDTISEESLAIISESLLHIINLLSDLPEVCQQAFLMNRLEGLRHKEIAKKLDIAPSTAKKYIAKALLHCHMATR